MLGRRVVDSSDPIRISVIPWIENRATNASEMCVLDYSQTLNEGGDESVSSDPSIL
jgi:hypothetical protein